MKKFVFQILVFVLPIVLLGIIAEGLLRNIPNDYSYKKSYLDGNADQIEKLFLGSSHAYHGVNPEFISGKAFNGSHIAQTLDYDLEILKKYEGRWDKLKVIAIPVDYFSLFTRISDGPAAWRGKNYKIYYDSEQKVDLPHNFELLSLKLYTNSQRIISHYLQGEVSIICSSLGFIEGLGKGRNIIESGVLAAEAHTMTDLSMYESNLAILQEFVRFGAMYDIKVVFYVSPAYSSYVEQLDENQLELTIKTLEQLAEENVHCFYFNFLTHPEFEESDFFDADHLNSQGAQKFSRIIDERINGV